MHRHVPFSSRCGGLSQGCNHGLPRKAVNALDEHGFVLLVGEPAAGRATIASMLAMAAADKWKSSVLKLADPAKVVERWNVDEPSQFFWIDDAFWRDAIRVAFGARLEPFSGAGKDDVTPRSEDRYDVTGLHL